MAERAGRGTNLMSKKKREGERVKENRDGSVLALSLTQSLSLYF